MGAAWELLLHTAGEKASRKRGVGDPVLPDGLGIQTFGAAANVAALVCVSAIVVPFSHGEMAVNSGFQPGLPKLSDGDHEGTHLRQVTWPSPGPAHITVAVGLLVITSPVSPWTAFSINCEEQMQGAERGGSAAGVCCPGPFETVRNRRSWCNSRRLRLALGALWRIRNPQVSYMSSTEISS